MVWFGLQMKWLITKRTHTHAHKHTPKSLCRCCVKRAISTHERKRRWIRTVLFLVFDVNAIVCVCWFYVCVCCMDDAFS